MGGTLTFGPADFTTPQLVTLGAAEDGDADLGTALIRFEADGFPTNYLTARELDDESSGQLYVDVDAAPNGDGLSWGTAFDDLQEALELAELGGGLFTQIWVAAGTYVPSVPTDPELPRTASFSLVNGVALYGGFEGTEGSLADRDPATHETILDGEGYSYHVVTAPVAVDTTAILDGFVITGGNASGDGQGYHMSGGGMVVESSSGPTIIGCVFRGNSGYNGGGLAGGSATIINCVFLGNTATSYGGGMTASQPQVINTVFSGNTGHRGGGIASGSATLTNCTFSANHALSLGGGAWVGNHTYTNCVFWGNWADERGHALCLGSGGTVTVSFSDVQGGESGIEIQSGSATIHWEGGNIVANPLFVDADGPDDISGTADDDLRLQQYSPCIDAGYTLALPLDDFDLDQDGNTTETIPFDLWNNPRRIDDPTKPDTGWEEPVVDMGVYEASSDRFFLYDDPIGVPEGGTADLGLHLAWDPGGVITVTVAFESGDGDLTIASGGELQFDSDDFTADKFVTLAAADDPNDQELGTAVFRITADDFPTGYFTAWEIDDDAGSTLYVKADAAPNGDGLSWGTAFDDLQEALELAELGGGLFTQIWVAAGTYVPSVPTDPELPRTASFSLVNGVALYGGFEGTEGSLADRDPATHETILDGEGYSYHVVTAPVAVDTTAILDGFVITGGNASGDGQGYHMSGGGMVVESSSGPTIIGCVFRGNSGYNGGGLAGGSATIINCVFLGNTATSYGGGMTASQPQVINTVFSGNTGHRGGGIASGSATLTNCTFSANHALSLGGGAWVGNHTYTNCVFWGNWADERGHALCLGSGGTVTVSFSDVQGGESGIEIQSGSATIHWEGGNIVANPLFVDADGPDDISGTADDDLRLQQYSPCIDAGYTLALPLDDFDLDQDGNTTETIPFDLWNNPRRIDDPTKPDTGWEEPVVDMGVYEASSDRFFLYDDPIGVPEGGTADLGLHLAWDPGGVITVTVAFESGDGDLTIASGGELQFDSDDFTADKFVTLAAADDPNDQELGTAVFRITADDFPTGYFTAWEIDDDAGSTLYVKADAAPNGDGLSWGTAFDDLQEALELAELGGGLFTQIWVAG